MCVLVLLGMAVATIGQVGWGRGDLLVGLVPPPFLPALPLY